MSRKPFLFTMDLPAVAHTLEPLDDIELFSSDFIFEIK